MSQKNVGRQALSAQRHIMRALANWPRDTIRPEVQFQEALRQRYEGDVGLSGSEQLKQANALYALLDNRARKKYPITGSLLKPQSNPTYFDDLLRELEEAPSRSLLQRYWLRLKGSIRLQ
ncbi:hypothetical protein F4780DRAFT_693796 [Xylariomycetidae sp. FL0641]|nr:hypothetical protein F4780DRAFT_693796 [Xylariomycetidae sp. FL0641]